MIVAVPAATPVTNPEESTDKKEKKDLLEDNEKFSDKSLSEVRGDKELKKETPITTDMLKAYFTPMGIDFPETATITYDRGSGKLIMKNFPKLMGDKSPTYPRNSQSIKLNKCHPPTPTHT